MAKASKGKAKQDAAVSQPSLASQGASFLQDGIMALVASSTDLVALATLDQRMTFLNPAGLALMGLPDLEAVRQTVITDYFGEEMADRLGSDVVPSVLATGSWQGVLDMRHFQTGERIPVFFNSTLVRDPQTGEPIGIGTVGREVSAMQKAERERQEAIAALENLNQELEQRIQQRTAELAASEQKFRAIFNNTFQFTGLMTPQGILLEANQTALDFAGLQLQDVRHQPLWKSHWWSLSVPEQQHLEAAVTQAAEGKFVRYEVDLRGVDTSVITVDFSIRPLLDERGQVVLLIPEARDITALKQTERALRDSQALLQLVMDNLPQAIFWKDQNLQYLGCNRQLLIDAGLNSVDEIIGKTDADLPWETEAPSYQADDREVMQSGQAKLNIEEPITKADRSHRWLRTNKIPLHSGDGELIGVLGTYEDITDRKRMETQLRDSNEQLAITNRELARATRLKDEFLATMSHELRTPLSSILGMAQALRREIYGALSDRQHHAIGIIERSGRHLLALINDVLDLAKIEAGRMDLRLAPVSLAELCEISLSLVQQQALQKQIHLSLTLPPQLPPIEADELRLKQALINLLDNAVKFTPKGGQVTLAVSLDQGEAIPDGVVFTVTDTGIGIAPADHSRLFESFVQLDSSLTREHGGTGLGLALVKRIVEMHGGTITVQSALGQGSQFVLRLPCEGVPLVELPEAVTSLTPVALPEAAKGSQPTILVAEDNLANRNLLVDVLHSLGYSVTTAQDGYEAVQQALAHPPDLIVMDVQMPGMDGIEAMQQIRMHPDLSHLPIIALTALVMPGDRERCLQAGATAYLAKPLPIDGLNTLLQRLL